MVVQQLLAFSICLALLQRIASSHLKARLTYQAQLRCLFALLSLLILPFPAHAHHLKYSSLEGDLQVTIVDSIDHKTGSMKSKKLYQLSYMIGGKLMLSEIVFEGGKVPRDFKLGKVKPGSRIMFRGFRKQERGKPAQIVISKYEGTKRRATSRGDQSASAFSANLGAFPLAVVVYPNPVTGALPCSLSDMQALVFNHVNAYFRESSYNQAWLTGEIFAPINGAVNPGPYISSTTGQPYTHILNIGYGQNLNGSNGYGSVGGNPSRAGSLYCSGFVVEHELGHNFGLGHASSLGQIGLPVEYGDASCVMGSQSDQATKNFNAIHRYELGWIPESKVLEVTSSGAYDIASLSTNPSTATNPLIVKVKKPNTFNEYYYLSYRTPTGFDQNLPTQYLNKVSVHTLAGNSFLASVLGDGQSHSPVSGVIFNVLSHTSSSARVQITVPQRQQYTVSGLVTSNGQPLAGATIETANYNATTTTGADGRYQLSIEEGSIFFISATKSGHRFPATPQTVFQISANTTINFAGSTGATYTISGRILVNGATPLGGVRVSETTTQKVRYTDADGRFSIADLPGGMNYWLSSTRGSEFDIRPSNISGFYYQGTLSSDLQADYNAIDLTAPTPSPTATATNTATGTSTATPSPSPTPTATRTAIVVTTVTVSPTPTVTPTPIITARIADIVVKDHVSNAALWANAQSQIMSRTDTVAPPSVPGITFIGNGQKLSKVGAVFSFSDGNGMHNFTPALEHFQLEAVFFPSMGEFAQYAQLLNGTYAVRQAYSGPTNPAPLTVVGHTANNDNLYYLEIDVADQNWITTPGQLQSVALLINTWNTSPGTIGYIPNSIDGTGSIGTTPDWAQADPTLGMAPGLLSSVTSAPYWPQPMNWLASKVLTSGTDQLGACCIHTTCTVHDSTSCSALGGEYQYAGSQCGAADNPTTCCPINFDGVDGVTPIDIFEFLSSWMAGQPRADFNKDGKLSFDDVTTFLNAWFIGC